MKPHEEIKVHTLRHFFFYVGLACLAGAVIGAAASAMDWSTGVVYAVGLSTALAISLIGLREGLFTPARRPDRHHRL